MATDDLDMRRWMDELPAMLHGLRDQILDALRAAHQEGRRAGLEEAERFCEELRAEYERAGNGWAKTDDARNEDICSAKEITAKLILSQLRNLKDTPDAS